MKQVIAALLILFGLANAALAQSIVGPPNAVLCNKSASFSSTTSTTSLVPANSSFRIFVCGWHVTTSSSASVTFSMSSGTTTTTPCDTNTTQILPALQLTSAAPSADHVDFAVLGTNNGVGLCITPSSTTITGIVYYSQY